MPEVRVNTGYLGAGVEIRFQGTVTGKVEIREPGMDWEPIEKVEGSVSGNLIRRRQIAPRTTP